MPSRTNELLLERYLRRGAPVSGWLNPLSARVIAELAGIQKAKNLGGSVGEIGVHHGRLFIVLYLTRWEDQRSFAIDVFGDQHLNVDRSGRGDEEAFLRNIRSWSAAPDEIAIIRKSSLEVAPAEILASAGRCRLMSIDGGHTVECVLNDMRLAGAVLQDFGVAVIDDFFNQLWPGVATGVALYCADPATELRPFAISPGKVYFARPQLHGLYRREMKERLGALYHKTSAMHGCEVDLYGTRPRQSRPAMLLLALRRKARRLRPAGLRKAG